jgi:hypothetical protein
VTDAERTAKHRQLAGDYADMILKDVASGILDRESCIQTLLNYAALTRIDHVDEIVERIREAHRC